MPELDTRSVLDWFRSHEPHLAVTLDRPFCPAEEPEETRLALVRLGACLDQARARDATALAAHLRDGSSRDRLTAILAQLGAARLLRLLDWLSEAEFPEPRVLLEAVLRDDPAGTGQAVRQAVSALHRRALLARIFAPERRQALQQACRIAEKT